MHEYKDGKNFWTFLQPAMDILRTANHGSIDIVFFEIFVESNHFSLPPLLPPN